MAKPAFLSPEVKMNFKLRDFFLDFMACIVPGLIFLVAVSIIVIGIFFMIDESLFNAIKLFLFSEIPNSHPASNDTFNNVVNTFSFTILMFLLVICLSYFAGHLLYRQNPKRPDYASFIRIRDRVMKRGTDSWVIPKGSGVRSSDVQFPYSNLKNYLIERGFSYLAKHVDWDKVGHRSKTVINRAKIRLAFYFPEQMVNLIRNEAHIRLASSMWYGAKYIIKLSYICFIFILVHLMHQCCLSAYGFSWRLFIFNLVLAFLLFLGYLFKTMSVGEMERHNPEKEEYKKDVDLLEDEVKRVTARVDRGWQLFDSMPLVLFIILYCVHHFGYFDLNLIRRAYLDLYFEMVIFILIGTLFSKRYIERTIHYQRVRELLYVLETAHIAKAFEDEDLPDPHRNEKTAYDINLLFKN